MTMPNTGWGGIPVGNAAPQPARDGNGYVHLGGGYQPQVGGPNSPPSLPPGLQQMMDGVSPLAVTPPNMPPMPGQVPPLQRQQPVPPQQVQQQAPQPQPNPFQAPVQTQGLDLNARLSGPNVPPELQGRSVGELVGMLNGLRQVHLASAVAAPQPVAQPSPAPQQTPPQQPQQNGQPATFDWRNPRGEFQNIVNEGLTKFRQEMAPVLAPVVQQGQLAAAQAARAQIASEIPNFVQLEPYIYQRLQGMAPDQLGNPEVWRVAARVAIGDVMLAPRNAQNQGVPVQQYQGAQQVLPGQSPMPNLNGFQGFFSEAPNQGGPAPQAGGQLNAAQRGMAAAMGISDADYASWYYGVQNQPGGRR